MYPIKPFHLIKKFYHEIPKGKILDIGCGKGSNSIFLAKNGFEILAIDINQEHIDYLNNLSEKEKLNLVAKKENVKDFKFNQKYSSILAINSLQFLKKSERDDVIKKIKEFIIDKGLVFISAFTTEDNSFKKFSERFQPVEENTFYSKKNENYRNFLNMDELKSYFTKGFEILHCEEKIVDDAHPLPHQHGITEIVAKKTSSI